MVGERVLALGFFGRYNSSYSVFVPDTVLPLEVQAHRIPQKQHFRALREEREYG
jgi:hypothetical protein